jgi:hypothetical protein
MRLTGLVAVLVARSVHEEQAELARVVLPTVPEDDAALRDFLGSPVAPTPAALEADDSSASGPSSATAVATLVMPDPPEPTSEPSTVPSSDPLPEPVPEAAAPADPTPESSSAPVRVDPLPEPVPDAAAPEAAPEPAAVVEADGEADDDTATAAPSAGGGGGTGRKNRRKGGGGRR